jgi:hypothetical protein
MNTYGHPCMYCGVVTVFGCPECGAACCMACGVNLCPLCVRVKLLQIEQAMLKRVVSWQHVEILMVPIRPISYVFTYHPEKLLAAGWSVSAPESVSY